MACQESLTCVLSVLPKVLCVMLLILQSALLDYIIIQLDTKASYVGRYIWIGLDSINVVFWIIELMYSHRWGSGRESNEKKKTKKMSTEGFTGKRLFLLALRSLPFAYVSWLLYAVILIAKINCMFLSFVENLTSNQESLLLSNTSLKIILSFAGVLLALLAYAHQDETHNYKYKRIIQKIGTSATLDMLDVIMLLDVLFVTNNFVEMTITVDRTIRAFSSICILLPVFPLMALRIVESSKTAKSDKSFPLAMIFNSAFYIFLVNVPLLIIRMYLWFHHEVDITTFLTKNVMAIAKGLLDINKDLLEWNRNRKKKADIESNEIQMEPLRNAQCSDKDSYPPNKCCDQAKWV